MKMGFFSITDHNRKISLADKINTLIFEIINGKEAFDFIFYFSEVWRQKGGFEVVIGNPPYVQVQNYSGQQIQKDWEKRNYKTFARTGDIYCLFYEKGHYLLRGLGPSRRVLAHSAPGL